MELLIGFACILFAWLAGLGILAWGMAKYKEAELLEESLNKSKKNDGNF